MSLPLAGLPRPHPFAMELGVDAMEVCMCTYVCVLLICIDRALYMSVFVYLLLFRNVVNFAGCVYGSCRWYGSSQLFLTCFCITDQGFVSVSDLPGR